MRELVSHISMPLEEEDQVMETDEPLGWQTLYSFLDTEDSSEADVGGEEDLRGEDD
jgi:hypothetical protein